MVKKLISLSFIKKSILLLVFLPALWACEDIIDLKTEKGPPLLVVDGWITNQPGPQEIRLTTSSAYFDNTPAPPVLGAEVRVEDDLGNIYRFNDENSKGVYRWEPSQPDSALGAIGRSYTLFISHGGDEYTAENQIKRVPPIDSLVFTHESWPFQPEEGPKDGFIAEFFARDFEGPGDCYWIKPLRDGKLFKNNPVFISIAYDAAYSKESAIDGLIFIQPLRQSLTLGVLLEDNELVGVELHSINEEAFDFLRQIRTESSNGGLFAVPSSNIPTNIKGANGKKALGFFGASAVSKMEQRVDATKARPKVR